MYLGGSLSVSAFYACVIIEWRPCTTVCIMSSCASASRKHGCCTIWWQGSTSVVLKRLHNVTRLATPNAAVLLQHATIHFVCPHVQAMSAFMFFSNAQREKVKADNPGIAFGEVGRKLGELWRAATAEEKKEYDEQAAADKVS